VTSDKNFKYVLLFSFTYSLICYSLAIFWYEQGYFTINNILFAANPETNLLSLSHGNGRNSITHAFLELFSIPVRLVDMLYSSFFEVADRLEFRKLIALSIAPIFSSLTLIYIYRSLILLNIEKLDANILTLLFAACFTNILFALVPETYAISCFLITYLLFYFLKNEKNESSGNKAVWFGIALLLCGVTITNICIFFLVFLVHLIRNERIGWFYAIRKASLYSIAVLLVTILFYKLSSVFDVKTGGEGNLDWAQHVTSSFWQFKTNIVNLFSASVNGFVGTSPSLIASYNELTRNTISFTRDKTDFLLLTGVAIIWGVAAVQSRKFFSDKKWRNLYFVCYAVIVFNFSLHALFGAEMFLYTQHWITPLFFLLVPILQNKRFISIGLLLLLVIINFNFLLNVEQMVSFKSP